jgi:hypothetical protein
MNNASELFRLVTSFQNAELCRIHEISVCNITAWHRDILINANGMNVSKWKECSHLLTSYASSLELTNHFVTCGYRSYPNQVQYESK